MITTGVLGWILAGFIIPDVTPNLILSAVPHGSRRSARRLIGGESYRCARCAEQCDRLTIRCLTGFFRH